MALNVKVYLEKDGNSKAEIRRFHIQGFPPQKRFESLKRKIADIFELNVDVIQLFWQDSDGDFVTFSSSDELREAVDQTSDNTFRVFARVDVPGFGKQSDANDSGKEKKSFHPGIVCDSCDKNIYGPRYKCCVCTDYDLCSVCEDRGIHSQHNKFKINHPQSAGGKFTFCPPPPPPQFHDWIHNIFKEKAGSKQPGGGSPPGFFKGEQADRSSGYRWSQGDRTQADDYLRNVGDNVRTLLSNIGVDVSYEVRHNDRNGGSGSFKMGGCGAGSAAGSGSWQCFMPGCPTSGGPGEAFSDSNVQKSADDAAEDVGRRSAKEQAERQPTPTESGPSPTASGPSPTASGPSPTASGPSPTASGPSPTASGPSPTASRPSRGRFDSLGIYVAAVDDHAVPATDGEAECHGDLTPSQSAPSAPNTSEDDWTMLSGGVIAERSHDVDGSDVSCPDNKVADSLRTMKAMGFHDEGGWLRCLLEEYKGSINTTLDAIKASHAV